MTIFERISGSGSIGAKKNFRVKLTQVCLRRVFSWKNNKNGSRRANTTLHMLKYSSYRANNRSCWRERKERKREGKNGQWKVCYNAGWASWETTSGFSLNKRERERQSLVYRFSVSVGWIRTVATKGEKDKKREREREISLTLEKQCRVRCYGAILVFSIVRGGEKERIKKKSQRKVYKSLGFGWCWGEEKRREKKKDGSSEGVHTSRHSRFQPELCGPISFFSSLRSFSPFSLFLIARKPTWKTSSSSFPKSSQPPFLPFSTNQKRFRTSSMDLIFLSLESIVLPILSSPKPPYQDILSYTLN